MPKTREEFELSFTPDHVNGSEAGCFGLAYVFHGRPLIHRRISISLQFPHLFGNNRAEICKFRYRKLSLIIMNHRIIVHDIYRVFRRVYR